MATVKLMLNKSRVSRDGLYPIVFQVIHSRRKKLLYVGKRVSEKQFDDNKERMVYHPDFLENRYRIGVLNKEIKQMGNRIRGVVDLFESRGVPYTVDQIVAQYALEQEDRKDFFLFSYFDRRIQFKKQLGKMGIMAAYQSTRSSIERYWGRVDIRLSEVTSPFVKGYQEYLQLNKVSGNTIAYYMRNFRTIYKYALEQSGTRMPAEDPFKDVGMQPCKTVKRALKRETLLQMAGADFSKRPALELARDMFLFSFYTRGMAFVDIIYLRKDMITDGVLTYGRRKTGQTLSIALTDQLVELIKKYPGDSRYLLPFMKDDTPEQMYRTYRLVLRRINNGLKELAKKLGIENTLTTYVARHTWATQAREYGASIALISEGLGHSSEKTTTIYLKQFDRSVLDQVNEIVTKLK